MHIHSRVFHTRFGHLTASTPNVGTGLRISVMLHLPALKITGELDKVARAASVMRLAIRGLYGEGTEATGDFFQLSNQTTLGKSEEQFAEDFRLLVPKFIEYERCARQSLMTRRTVAVEDKVVRALALLRSARLMSSEETMYLLSLVRLGTHVGLVKNVQIETVNELFLATQPSHLQRIVGRGMTGPQRAEARAEYIRRRLQNS
ncbi:MAG: hypothetical protein H8D26_00920 [Methanomicrobia archaeon]|nr:hypothetical protein [Methanomicrobia archaeon]